MSFVLQGDLQRMLYERVTAGYPPGLLRVESDQQQD